MCSSLCQSAIKGKFRNVSLLNARLLGLLLRVECIAALMACIGMNKISSKIFFDATYILGKF
jgi:hypothetical protein